MALRPGTAAYGKSGQALDPYIRSDGPPAEGCTAAPPHGNYRVSLWSYQNWPSPLCPLALKLSQTKLDGVQLSLPHSLENLQK